MICGECWILFGDPYCKQCEDCMETHETIADLVIILCRLATMLGVNIRDEVNKKMVKNREREKW